MSKTTTLAKARAYFIDASIEQPDGSCKRVADVRLAELDNGAVVTDVRE